MYVQVNLSNICHQSLIILLYTVILFYFIWIYEFSEGGDLEIESKPDSDDDDDHNDDYDDGDYNGGYNDGNYDDDDE
jgi:hypothetical protein